MSEFNEDDNMLRSIEYKNLAITEVVCPQHQNDHLADPEDLMLTFRFAKEEDEEVKSSEQIDAASVATEASAQQM